MDQRVTVDVPVSTDKNAWAKRNPGQIAAGPGRAGSHGARITGAKEYIDRGGRLRRTSGTVELDATGRACIGGCGTRARSGG